jgi:hypothetical protein
MPRQSRGMCLVLAGHQAAGALHQRVTCMALLAAAVRQAVALPTPQGESASRQGEFLIAAVAGRAVADERATPPVDAA